MPAQVTVVGEHNRHAQRHLGGLDYLQLGWQTYTKALLAATPGLAARFGQPETLRGRAPCPAGATSGLRLSLQPSKQDCGMHLPARVSRRPLKQRRTGSEAGVVGEAAATRNDGK